MSKQLKVEQEATRAANPPLEARIAELEQSIEESKARETKANKDLDEVQSQVRALQEKLQETLLNKEKDISKLKKTTTL